MCRAKLPSVIVLAYFQLNLVLFVKAANYSYINLPDSHLPYYFRNFPQVAEQCAQDSQCEYRYMLNERSHTSGAACWGHEPDCTLTNAFSRPKCPGDHTGWVKSKEIQIDTFYTQADFGFIKQQNKELMVMCEPIFPHDSSLECSKYLRFCRGRNIFLNFTDLATRSDPIRYKMDVLKPGQIGGFCGFKEDRLKAELDHMSALQSWAPELRNFVQLTERPIDATICDVVIERPTFLMKIDATINMYHHFCDFFNLYASLHANASHPTAYSQDVNILVWESYTYSSPFSDTFRAFTNYPVMDLKAFRGETVCFRNLVFPLLPRMIFGLYYNTPIISGCERSGLFRAFSEHILHRLNVTQQPRLGDDRIRVTLISRQTKYRQIMNEDELILELAQDDQFEIQKVEYGRDIPFLKQLEITHNTDILIGMHGAGLTHLMFLPNWATIFELYNCEDPSCYLDLASLRGVNYLTWEKPDKFHQQDEGHHPDGGGHAKFTNYAFDKVEFVRMVNKAAKNVRSNPEFKEFIKYESVIIERDEL